MATTKKQDEIKNTAQSMAGTMQPAATPVYKPPTTQPTAQSTAPSYPDLTQFQMPQMQQTTRQMPQYQVPDVQNWDQSGNQYYQQAQQIWQAIQEQKPFEFDLNGNALYQQYRDQYQRLGQRAMQDTMGQAAGLTGGYGSSYAQGVGQQAYDEYLQQLNDIVPELYAQERSAYEADRQAMYQQLGAAQGMYDRDYQAYLADRDYLRAINAEKYDAEMDAYRTEYGERRDALSDEWNRYQQNVANAEAKYNADNTNYWRQTEFDYNRYADDRNFNYGIYRDDVADQQRAQQLELERDNMLYERNHQAEREAISDARYDTEWAAQQEQQANSLATAERKEAYSRVMSMIETGYMPSAEDLAAAGIPADFARYYVNMVQAGGYGGGGSYGGGGRYTPSVSPDNDLPNENPKLTAVPNKTLTALATIYANNGQSEHSISEQLAALGDQGYDVKAAWKWIRENWKDYVTRGSSGGGGAQKPRPVNVTTTM